MDVIEKFTAQLAKLVLADGQIIDARPMVQSAEFKDKQLIIILQGVVKPNDTMQVNHLENIRQAVEKQAKKMSGVKAVQVILTAEREQPTKGRGPNPWAEKITPLDVKHIIAIASGKGGVGKSTVTAQLAFALQRAGYRVGVCDADIYGPSQIRMLQVGGQKPEVVDGKLQPLENNGIKIISMGALVPEGDALIWRGPMVQTAITQLLRDVHWGPLDYLLIDLPPGTGDAQLTLVQKVALTGAVIVSTPQDIALLDARRAIAMFQKVDVPILGIIENMSYFCCPNCNYRSEIFAHGGARAEAEKLQVPFLGEIPLTLAIRAASDQGQAYIENTVYDDIANQLQITATSPLAGQF